MKICKPIFFIGILFILSIFISSENLMCSSLCDISISDPPFGVHRLGTWSSGEHSLVAKNEDIFLVFSRDKLEGGKRDIYFDKSRNGGLTWGPDIRVDPTLTDPSHQNYFAAVFDTNDCFCVLWSDGRGYSGDTTFNLFFRKTCNACDSLPTFQSEVRVSDAPSYAWQRPSIAIDTINCYIYVSWSRRIYYGYWYGYKYDIYFYRSTDCGVSWEAGKKISGEWDACEANILVDKRRYIYVFYDVNHSQIFVRKSTDFGVTWSGPIRIDWNDPSNAGKASPSSATDSVGNLFVGWHDNRNLNSDIFFSNSTNAGNNWSASRKINDDVGLTNQDAISIVAKGNCEVFASWEDDRNLDSKDDIYFSMSSDCGKTWSGNVLVNDTTSEKDAFEGDPSLIVTDYREMFCAWVTNRNCPRPCDKYDVFGSPPLCSISGYLRDSLSGTPLAGYVVHLIGDNSAMDTTDEDGNYRFAYLPKGDYEVYVFETCYHYQYNPLCQNKHGQNFICNGSICSDVEESSDNEVFPTLDLSQNYPNPFNPATQISYSLPKNCNVIIVIYNVLGQKVKTLVDEFQTAGYKTVHWDGKDDQGNEVASGVYFYKLKAGDFSETKKMILMK